MLNEKKTDLLLVISGVFIGFINGFLGGGGGTLVVIVLLALLQLSQKQAHATAILVILPVSVLSAVVYFFNGSVDWLPTLYATIGVVGGGICGALLLNKLKGNVIKIIFAIIMLIAAVRMFVGIEL